jgi:hypothetical protein
MTGFPDPDGVAPCSPGVDAQRPGKVVMGFSPPQPSIKASTVKGLPHGHELKLMTTFPDPDGVAPCSPGVDAQRPRKVVMGFSPSQPPIKPSTVKGLPHGLKLKLMTTFPDPDGVAPCSPGVDAQRPRKVVMGFSPPQPSIKASAVKGLPHGLKLKLMTTFPDPDGVAPCSPGVDAQRPLLGNTPTPANSPSGPHRGPVKGGQECCVTPAHPA